jgi:Na+/melibiose symporter-like transporter
LPQHTVDPSAEKTGILDDWRIVVANRSFLLFAAAMIGSYVLSFQVYLALPLHAAVLTPQHESLIVAAVFVVSGLVAVGGQLRITRWFAARWKAGRSLTIGMTILAISFVPLMVVPNDGRFGVIAAVVALLASAALLAAGSAAVFPFEMDTVVALAGGRLVATHYGFYNTIVGIGILAGNLATGALLQATRNAGADELLWGALAVIGLMAALALHRLDRTGHLRSKAGQPVSIDQ